jgi:hypothetical protein
LSVLFAANSVVDSDTGLTNALVLRDLARKA